MQTEKSRVSWFDKPATGVISLLFCGPLGLVWIWARGIFALRTRIVVSAVWCLLMVIGIANQPPKPERSLAKTQAPSAAERPDVAANPSPAAAAAPRNGDARRLEEAIARLDGADGAALRSALVDLQDALEATAPGEGSEQAQELVDARTQAHDALVRRSSALLRSIDDDVKRFDDLEIVERVYGFARHPEQPAIAARVASARAAIERARAEREKREAAAALARKQAVGWLDDVDAFCTRYREQTNEIKASAVFRELKQFVGSRNVKQAKGRLRSLSTDQGGSSVMIRIDLDEVETELATSVFAPIRRGTSVYRQLEELDEGDCVLVTTTGGLKPSSLREESQVCDKEYFAQFSRIERCPGAGAVATDD